MSNHNSTTAQRQRLLEALRKRPLTTIEIREELGIIAPAARIWDLRHKDGHHIDTLWKWGTTLSGDLHKVGLYVLIKEKKPS